MPDAAVPFAAVPDAAVPVAAAVLAVVLFRPLLPWFGPLPVAWFDELGHPNNASMPTPAKATCKIAYFIVLAICLTHVTVRH